LLTIKEIEPLQLRAPKYVLFTFTFEFIGTLINKNILRHASAFLLLAMTIALSLSVKAATLESEMSQVTLFVEGMMKSRGGVT
jgi:uncharacterized Rmd1/YagE family protein